MDFSYQYGITQNQENLVDTATTRFYWFSCSPPWVTATNQIFLFVAVSHGDKPDFPVRHMEAVCRDGDFSIKGGNLGVGKKISINILKIKSVEVFFCCIWLMYLKLYLIHSKLGKLFHMNFFVHFLNYLGAVHLSHDTWRGRGSQAKYHSLSQGEGGSVQSVYHSNKRQGGKMIE